MIDDNNLYVHEDITFCNTDLIKHSAEHFNKYNTYCSAPAGSVEYEDFWDEEENRRLNGVNLFGELRADGEIQEVLITGEHYGFLNYAQIMVTTDEEEAAEIKKLTKGQRKAGKKVKTFPDFWDGHWNYMTAKKYALDYGFNMVVSKARRKGFSYIEAWDSADSINMNPDVTVLLTAFDLKYLTKGDQMMGMAKSYLDFLEKNTAFNRGYLVRKVDEVELGFTPEHSKLPEGYRSKLLALSFGPANPDAAIGKDGYKIKVEEAGKAPNMDEFLEVTLSTMEDGDVQTGSLVVFGTGGTKDANWESFERVYYNPSSINALAFKNVTDEGMEHNTEGCGFFFQHRQNLRPHIDKNGNSMFETADASIKEKRADMKKKAKTPGEYTQYISQRANCGQEAFSSTSSNILPNVSDQLHRVINDEKYKYLGQYGSIKNTPNGLDFVVNPDITAINNFPLKKGDDLEGCLVMWFPIYRDPVTGRTPKGLYRLWNDPYGVDKDKKDIKITDSLAATYIYERVNPFTVTKGDILVGAYVGRPERQETYNEQMMLINAWCNGMLTVENDRGDAVKATARKMKLYHTLTDEPDFSFNPEISGKHGRRKGISMANPKRQAAALIYLRDWLMTKRGTDDLGNIIYNYHMIYDDGLLREIIKYLDTRNCDRVSTLKIGMFDMQEIEVKAINHVKLNKTQSSFVNAIRDGNLFVHE